MSDNRYNIYGEIMTLNDLLFEKKYTVYKLSKETGIPKSTLFDLFSGKSNLLDCRLRVIVKLSEAFNIQIEDLVKLEPIIYKPIYEENLPEFLYESLKQIKYRKNRNDPLFDSYLDEANSSINVCEIENIISKEQADYLRRKYLN